MQKDYRLKSNASFNYIYKRGKSVSNKYMVLVYVKTYQKVKVGFSVSKKVGNAVVRNRTKRLLREAFSKMLPNVNPKNNYIVIARKPIVDLDFHQIEKSLKSLLEKSNLLSE